MVAVKQGQVRSCGWIITVEFDAVRQEKTARQVKVLHLKSD